MSSTAVLYVQWGAVDLWTLYSVFGNVLICIMGCLTQLYHTKYNV